ncbi:MAG: hypothetical protein V3U52_08070 [Thermoplasmata archaeon]
MVKTETVPKRLFLWLTILFVVGNFIFTNIFVQFMGFMGIPLGIGVSGSLTLKVLFMLRGR